ncbi:MAG: IPT/TIG domain-containing protein, partial [Imperialibacter sp.]
MVLPSISSGGFSPAKGVIGSTLTITGAGFVAADASLNVVNFNGGVTATASAATASSLTVQVPEGAITGALNVTVNGTTTGPFSAASFVIVPQIDAAGLSITSGYGGESLTITGKGFSSIAANNTDNFGGEVSAVPFSATTTSLGVTVPAGFTTGALTVTTTGEASAASAQTFIRKSVVVTAPNGGETFNLGDSYTITWTEEGLDADSPVTISYSADGGVSYTEIVAGVVGDFSGTFDWTPESEPTTAAKIKVTVDGDKASDESDDDFTVRIKPLLTVVYPNGGETIRFGKPAQIEFTTEGLDPATSLLFEYSIDNGANYQQMGSGTIEGLAGVYDLVMEEAYSDEALVRISTETGESVRDVSDEVFTSLPKPALAITSPTEGETLFIGASHDVTWTAQYLLDSDELELFYSADNGTTFSSKGIGPASELAGKMTVTIEAPVSQEAQFKLVNAGNDVSAISATFSIVPAPSIVITAPESGEILAGGVEKQITWTTTSVDPGVELVVEYSADGGATYESLTSGTASALNGSFDWSVPNAATANGFVRVRTADGTVSDTNNEAFIIQAQVTSLSISGLLVTPGGSAVNVVEVLLYKANAAGGWDIVSTDELLLAENRNTFSFVNLEAADYLIFAKPDRARFPNLRNTWFGNTLLVREAVTLSLTASRSDVDIEVVEVAPAPTGRGVVKGRLVNTSGNSRVSGLEIGRI